MGLEIELKLLVHDEWKDRILRHPLVNRFAVGEGTRHRLINVYYDTPGFQLRSLEMALRVRKDGDGYVQTLKTSGKAIGGLTHRGEWEWALKNDRLQPGLIPQALWPPGGIQSAAPLFQTDFERTKRLIHLAPGALQSNQPEAKIELAFDRGQVWTLVAGEKRTDDLCEIEMELVTGEPATLFDFALLLTDGVSAQPCDISKAQRGYRLLGAQPGHAGKRAALPEMTASAESVFSGEMANALGVWVKRLEHFQHDRNPAHLKAVHGAISHIGQLLDFFQAILPLAQVQRWKTPLSTAAGECPKTVTPDHNGTTMLALAKWIYCREWRGGQTEDQRQSAGKDLAGFAGAGLADFMNQLRAYQKAVSAS